MFGFSKKKKPQNALDEFIFAVYGNPPPAKRANLEQAITLANELLMGVVPQQEVRTQGVALEDGPIPYSTHDLALSIALNFFKQPDYIPQLFTAQLMARMKALQWFKEGLAVGPLVKSFEDIFTCCYRCCALAN